MKPPEPVAAIAEDAASGETARIYAEIRQSLGIVNLIWRHLATIDGALPWAWSALGPAYASGAITRHTDSLRATARSLLPSIEPLPEEVLRCAGLSGDDCDAIRNIVASYERSNAANAVATKALLHRVATSAPGRVTRAPRAMSVTTPCTPPFQPLLPMLAMSDLGAPAAALVLRLNDLCSTHDRPIQVSIYRHIGHWPAFLALAWTQVAPLVASGRLGECALLIDRQARQMSEQVALSLGRVDRHALGEKALAGFLDRIGLPMMIMTTAVHARSLGIRDAGD